MSDDRFEASWLELREPVDHRSRDAGLTSRLAGAVRSRGWSRGVDLGGGTGSNLRYLAPRCPGVERWSVVDHDLELLEAVTVPDREVERVVGDLAREGLEVADRVEVISASALLDLVTESWLARLAGAVQGREVGILFALSYDGTVEWEGGDAEDVFVLDAVNRHQRGTKGMGRALGPDAVPVARRLLEAAGFECAVRPSPWRLSGVADAPLTLRLMEGWAAAALEIEPDAVARLAEWRKSREARVREGDFSVTVGHLDLLALPASRP